MHLLNFFKKNLSFCNRYPNKREQTTLSRADGWPSQALLPKNPVPYPRNCVPVGPSSTSRLARASPSTMGGMHARRCLFTRRQVTRVGAEHFRGGTMMRRPWCRHPRMAPPRASTMKLTKKLCRNVQEVQKRPKKHRQTGLLVTESQRRRRRGIFTCCCQVHEMERCGWEESGQ